MDSADAEEELISELRRWEYRPADNDNTPSTSAKKTTLRSFITMNPFSLAPDYGCRFSLLPFHFAIKLCLSAH